MPFLAPIIGAVVSAVGAVGAAITAVGVSVGLGAAAGTITSLIGTLALTAGLSLVSSLFRGKPPPARGSVAQVVIDPDAPQSYPMGEGLFGGAMRHDTAYGPTLDDVPNPYRWMVIDYAGGGPIESIEPYVEQEPIDGGYYGGYLDTDTQLGSCPESTALVPSLNAPAPGWDSSSKLSGHAAIGWNFKFDKEGKKFASGLPQLGAYGKWVKVYDPRLDNTFSGGSGSHVLGDESTYTWSENPALHAATYAFGRYQNGKRTLGVGLAGDAIDWANIAAWANVCDANGWRLFGIVYEPDDRWQNLKDIADAGGAVPVIANGQLSFHYSAPRVSLADITEADIADGMMTVTAMRSYRDRINTIIPKYRSADHHWELVAAEAVSVPSLITEDGEEKRQEWPFNFVKDVDQAAQLARYVIEDGRELQPIDIVCGPHLRGLRPGDCVRLDLPQIGLDTLAVILRREFDPGNLTVKFTLIGETPEKHAFALGQTGTPPPTPFVGQSQADRDGIAGAVSAPASGETYDGGNAAGVLV